MTFSFNLEWDELDEDLKEEKIDAYLLEHLRRLTGKRNNVDERIPIKLRHKS